MKTANGFWVVVAGLAVLLVAMPLVACAKPATAPAPAPSPAPAPKPAPASKSSPLDAIIEGAKKEGALTVTLSTTHTPAPVVARMRKEIKDKYGVDLELKVTGTEGMAQILANAVMEYKTGTIPNYDALYMGSDDTIYGQKEGIFEMVDWKSLLQEGTVPEVIPRAAEVSSGIIMWSGMSGIMFNSKKVSRNDVPKTLGQMGDPKWKGKIGIMNYPDYYTRWAFFLGADKTKSDLKAIMKNQPVTELMSRLNNRFVIGEVDIALISATYLDGNREKGVAAEWQALDFVESRDFQIMVVKRARNPNAAKLFAVYMVSPDGVKLNLDVGKGNRFYPFGGLLYEMVKQATEKKAFYALGSNPEMLKFSLSSDYEKLQQEFALILKGG